MSLHSVASAVLRFALLALKLWAFIGATLFITQRALLYPTTMAENFEWKSPGVEKLALKTSDGILVKGYWRAPKVPGGPVVVSFMGNASAPETHVGRFSRPPWSDSGWGFLAVSYPGYPGSTGSPSEATLLATGEAATAFAVQRSPASAILYHAHSLGTGVAVAEAAQHPSKGLYLEAPYSSIATVGHSHYWLWPEFLVLDTFRSDLRMAAVRAPILMVHGDQDVVINQKFGRALMAAVPSGDDAKFISVSGGSHDSVFGVADIEAEKKFRDAPAIAPL